jgi:hypothetical protein
MVNKSTYRLFTHRYHFHNLDNISPTISLSTLRYQQPAPDNRGGKFSRLSDRYLWTIPTGHHRRGIRGKLHAGNLAGTAGGNELANTLQVFPVDCLPGSRPDILQNFPDGSLAIHLPDSDDNLGMASHRTTLANIVQQIHGRILREKSRGASIGTSEGIPSRIPSRYPGGNPREQRGGILVTLRGHPAGRRHPPC